MENFTTKVGMDVHARSIFCKILNVKTGETRSKHFTHLESDEEVAAWINTLPKPVHAAYESGCTGFHLAERLNKINDVKCEIIAITTLRKSTKEKSIKCDKIDASLILSEIANPVKCYETVYIPPKEMQAKRELAKILQVAKNDLRNARQRLNGFLTRQGYVWNQRTATGKLKKKWNNHYYKWVSSIEFDFGEMNFTLHYLLEEVKNQEVRVREIEQKISKYCQEEKQKKMIDALCALKGVEKQTAYLIAATFSEFRRFKKARQVSSYFGVVPRKHASGETDNNGRITKSGDKYSRSALVESTSSISRWSRKKVIPTDAVVSNRIREMANTANTRIKEKYIRLIKNGKNVNVAKIACVSELFKWIWAIGCEVEREVA